MPRGQQEDGGGVLSAAHAAIEGLFVYPAVVASQVGRVEACSHHRTGVRARDRGLGPVDSVPASGLMGGLHAV